MTAVNTEQHCRRNETNKQFTYETTQMNVINANKHISNKDDLRKIVSKLNLKSKQKEISINLQHNLTYIFYKTKQNHQIKHYKMYQENDK